MLKKWLVLSALGLSTFAKAAEIPDEGMWLPVNIQKLNYSDMQKRGLKLTAEDLYSVNNTSLKDAIVRMGSGFCTGEIISSQGLLLTNHHCGFDLIQSHSSVKNDYLTNGFWAMKKEDELPNPGLSVSFLVRMEDVTTKILANVTDEMTDPQRMAAIQTAVKGVREGAEKGTGYSAEVKAIFNGNQYILLVYEIYKDVRLVGAPPTSIGKFGGDTDNWMWPRHTGDFSMFRVYMSRDGKPADYSKDNVPLKPRNYLKVSMSGIQKEDYAMIWGYPGRTDRYLTSFGVKMATDQVDPLRVKIRRKKLDTYEEGMNADPAVKIKYASKHASVANYWKYFMGEAQGLKRLKVADKKEAEEKAFTQWVAQDPARAKKYGNALTLVSKYYNTAKEYRNAEVAMQEAIFGIESIMTAATIEELMPLMSGADSVKAKYEKASAKAKASLEETWKDYDLVTDKKLFAEMLKQYMDATPASQQPAKVVALLNKKFKGDYKAFAEEAFAKSVLVDKNRLEEFLAKPNAKKLEKDLVFITYKEFADNLMNNIQPKTRPLMADLEKGNRLYVAGLMEMQKERKFYPNANATMRVTYGRVLDYKARDAVQYNYFTTIDGIMEKEDPSNEEFIVPARLKELWKKKDFGPYAEEGVLKVGFLTDNDITGGNSGSPVINGRGELIGLAFDGNWEAMSGNIAFEPELQRTICNDIRYVLFVIDKFAGAKHLVDEMTLAYAPKEVVATPTPVVPVSPVNPVSVGTEVVKQQVEKVKANAAKVVKSAATKANKK